MPMNGAQSTILFMSEYRSVADRVDSIRQRITAAAKRAGRRSEEIRILGVSKFHPAQAVLAAYAAGLRYFGENRVQEAEGKYASLLGAELPDIQLDMIGNLQSNKINKALALFDGIQSIGSQELLQAVLARAVSRKKPLRLCLELHTAEDSKSGFTDLDTLYSAVEDFMRYPEKPKGLILSGLMTMAPFTEDKSSIRASFRSLSKAFAEIQRRFSPPGFSELSMGMSGDFELAVEEGSTIVRLGTAIFGERS